MEPTVWFGTIRSSTRSHAPIFGTAAAGVFHLLMPPAKIYTPSELAQHASAASLYIAIHGKVYDVTAFAVDHPGGKNILLKHAGTDATAQFDMFHGKHVLEKYGNAMVIGDYNVSKSSTENTTQSNDVDMEADQELHEPFGELVPFGDPAWYQDEESPYYKDSHRRLRKKIRDFVDTEIMPFVHEWDEAGKVPDAIYKKCAQENILAAICGVLPLDYMHGDKRIMGVVDPEEWDHFHEFIIGDELARCCSGGVLWGIMGGLGIGLPPILMFGSDELKQRIIPDCISGNKTICLAYVFSVFIPRKYDDGE